MLNKYELINSTTDKDTKMSIAKIYEAYEKAKFDGVVCNTHFLSPNMISFVLENFSDNEIILTLVGGYENAERMVVMFNKKNKTIDLNPIDVLKITYNTKYSRELKHSDYLGSILGLSIKREIIGDIVVCDGYAYIFVLSSMSDFLIQNLKKVGRTNIDITKISNKSNEIDILIQSKEEAKTTVSSLRIDVVICKIFNISRNEIKDFFESGKIFVNWICVSDISKSIKENDIITLRGFGRIKYLNSNGTNKKGKISISYLKY